MESATAEAGTSILEQVTGAVHERVVGQEFYGALDKAVRGMIADAEARALGNKRKTLKAVDL